MTENGLSTLQSIYSVAETAERTEAELRTNNLTLFARIDHAAGAAEANMKLRPTQLLAFGNPKAGTPLMQAEQVSGIDPPLKVLVWKDAEGKVWLSYNDPTWIAHRHQLPSTVNAAINTMTIALEAFAKSAAGLFSGEQEG